MVSKTSYDAVGGGLYLTYRSTSIVSTRFYSNTATRGGGIYSDNTNYLMIADSEFIRNTTTQEGFTGGGLYVNGGHIQIDNVDFIENYSKNRGGGISVEHGWGYINGCRFISNEVQGRGVGAGISLSYSTTWISNSLFQQNTAYEGSGLYAYDATTFLQSSKFFENIGSSGAGLMINNGSISLIDSQVVRNSALDGAGGYYFMTTGIISNTQFISNTTTTDIGRGGGLNIFQSDVDIYDSTFSENTAGNGGGIFLEESNLMLNGFQISNNFARDPNKGYGGGIDIYKSSAVMVNGKVSENEANYGGGLTNETLSNSNFVNVNFSNNHAVYLGGAVGNIITSTVSVVNGIFYDNSALYGGGFGNGQDSVDKSSFSLVNTDFLRNSTTDSGSAVFNSSGAASSISNSIILDNNPFEQLYISQVPLSINYSIVQDGCPSLVTCNHIITSNPMFMDPINGDLRLLGSSPAIDAGDNSALPLDFYDLDEDGNKEEPFPMDFVLQKRFVDHSTLDTGSGSPPIIDLGAYETPNHAPVLDNS
ncbi:hypothetical protein EHM76_06080, partial [bacterium]